MQKVPQKHARTCKKLPVASFCASETAETGRIANGREQGDHVSRRQESYKGGIAAEKAAKPQRRRHKAEISREAAKDLIGFVRSRHCGELNRGLQNLGTPCEGVRIGTFCGVQKVPQKHAEGCDPLDSRGRFKALSKKILAELPTARAETGFSHKTAAKRL